MAIIYIISFVILFASLFLLKKSDKKQNIVLWSVINFTLTWIINSVIIFILSLLNLEATLLIRSIFFIGLSIPIIVYTYKNKKIQKYEIEKKDIIFSVFAIILVAFIGFYRFGPNMDIYFETTDPAVHYLYAERFADSNKLLEKLPADLAYGKTENSSLFLSYTALGTVFQIIDTFDSGFVSKVNSFVIFELVILLFSVILLYYSISHFTKKWSIKKFILTCLLLVLYTFGYPFNNLIFGFHYLGISVLIALMLFIIIQKLIKEKPTWINLSIIGLFAFSIFTTYYLFVPVIYGAIGLYILYCWKFKDSIDLKTAIKYIGIGLVIPFIIGMYYIFFQGSSTSQITGTTSAFDVFKLDGYIYRNLIANFLFLFIVGIYRMFYDLKKKKMNVYEFAVILDLLFIGLLLIFIIKGDIASYYFYKLYYVLWPITFLVFGTAIVDECRETNGLATSILITMALLFTAQTTKIDDKLFAKDPLLNNSTFVRGITDIYWFNHLKCDKEITKYIYSNQELNDLEKIYLEYKDEFKTGNITFYGDLLQKLWFYDLMEVMPMANFTTLGDFYLDNVPLEETENNMNVEYVIVYTTDESNYNSQNFEKIYKNKSFILLKRDKGV